MCTIFRHATYFICCKVSLICETFRVKWTCFCTVCNAGITKHFEEFSSKWWNVKTSMVLNIRFQIRGNRFICTMKSPLYVSLPENAVTYSKNFFYFTKLLKFIKLVPLMRGYGKISSKHIFWSCLLDNIRFYHNV